LFGDVRSAQADASAFWCLSTGLKCSIFTSFFGRCKLLRRLLYRLTVAALVLDLFSSAPDDYQRVSTTASSQGLFPASFPFLRAFRLCGFHRLCRPASFYVLRHPAILPIGCPRLLLASSPLLGRSVVSALKLFIATWNYVSVPHPVLDVRLPVAYLPARFRALAWLGLRSTHGASLRFRGHHGRHPPACSCSLSSACCPHRLGGLFFSSHEFR